MKGIAKAQLKHLRMSPQKVRLVAGLMRDISVEEALVQLTYSKKRAARPLKKLLESAVANAVHNAHLAETGLKIEQIFVNEGPILYRWMPRAMGRATPLRKRSSHVTIVLTGEIDEKKKREKIADEDKKVDDTTPEESAEQTTPEKKPKTVKKTTKSNAKTKK